MINRRRQSHQWLNLIAWHRWEGAGGEDEMMSSIRKEEYNIGDPISYIQWQVARLQKPMTYSLSFYVPTACFDH